RERIAPGGASPPRTGLPSLSRQLLRADRGARAGLRRPAGVTLQKFVIPAQAGTHFSAGRAVARWVPAFAGMTISIGLRYRSFWPSAVPPRKMLGLRKTDSTRAPCGDLAMWRLPLGRQT